MKAASFLYTALALFAETSSAFNLPKIAVPTTPESPNTIVSQINHPYALQNDFSFPAQWLASAPIVIAFFFSFAPPSVAMEGDIARGNQAFTASCAGCHAGGQNFVNEKKTLQKEALDKFVGLDEEKVQAFFKGSFVHKVVGGKLSDQEIADVATYVVDQAKGDKW